VAETSMAAGTRASQTGEESPYWTVKQAARHLSRSRATIYNLMGAGELRFCKFGRSRRIPREVVLQYAAACLVG
jgi:excisionase family DNA binding protein